MTAPTHAPADLVAADWRRAHDAAETIRQQIGHGPLMSLGAHDFRTTIMDGGSPALHFAARILRMKADGTRSEQVRNMHVLVWLTAADDYGIRVSYIERFQLVKHYEASGIYADQLARLMLSLDYDGDTVRNPRLI